jgi:DNA repair exonuclease SbcCD nuclease subunit
MTTVVFFTDPHLGLRRTANTTPASRRRLQDEGFNAVESIYEHFGPKAIYLCLGDWFDSYSNPESITQRAAPLISRCDYSLAGNHDLVNDADRSGSLELLRAVVPKLTDKLAYTQFGHKGIDVFMLPHSHGHDDIKFVSVPHVTDQTLFDKSLAMAYDEAKRDSKDTWKMRILLLHCNYDNPMTGETDLNLSEEQAKEMLDVYDYVFLGHEHQPRTLFDGRLIVLGNTLPTGFGDISNKFVTVIKNGKIPEFHQIWDVGSQYYQAEWQEVSEWLSTPIDGIDHEVIEEIQFVKLTGKAGLSDAKELALTVKGLWAGFPNLLALKTDVEIEGLTAAKASYQGVIDRLPELITKELEGSELRALWDEILTQINAEKSE